MDNKSELFLCSCNGEGISVEKSDKDLIYLSLWCRGQRPSMSLWGRIKYCFSVLKTGYLWNDEIVMFDETARGLARYILSVTEVPDTGLQSEPTFYYVCEHCSNLIPNNDYLCPKCGEQRPI